MTGEFLFSELSDDAGIDMICTAIAECCRDGRIEPDGDVASRALRLYGLGNNTTTKLSNALRAETLGENGDEPA